MQISVSSLIVKTGLNLAVCKQIKGVEVQEVAIY